MQVMGISGESREAFASCQVVHGNTVCVWSALVVKAKFNAVLDSHRSNLANLISLALKVAVATVTSYGYTALRDITGITVVTFPTFADRPVKPANAVCVGATPSLDAGSGAVLDASRIGQAAVALRTVGILDADVE